MYFVPAPEFISVICPKCEKYATFKKSVGVANIEKADRKYFEKSKHFDTFYTKLYGRYQHEVWYDAGLSNPLENIHDLPQGYSAKIFKPSKYLRPLPKFSRGVISCNSCTLRKRTNIDWPNQAYFKLEYKDNTLWAYDRNMTLAILEYLKDPSRKKVSQSIRNKTSYNWLNNLPTVFQTKKATPHIIKKLGKLLS